MSTDKTLLDQIDDLVASKTFNLDALEGIKKIKDSLKATLEERDALKTLCYELCETNIRKDEEIRRLTDHLTEQGSGSTPCTPSGKRRSPKPAPLRTGTPCFLASGTESESVTREDA